MNGLDRDFVEEGLDVRPPFAIRVVSRQAMHKSPGVDRMGTRGVDGLQNAANLRLSRRGPLEGLLQPPAERLDIANGDRRHLDLDAADFALFLLHLPVSPDAAGDGTICHDGSPLR
ncbi:MAG: hypothetical protein E6Q98_11875 [Rhodospirillaceae bacterium]|nr:MAG: hypothetical protein E6Q98_11875 [Rhodospirillaceae bacterium]